MAALRIAHHRPVNRAPTKTIARAAVGARFIGRWSRPGGRRHGQARSAGAPLFHPGVLQWI